MVNADIEVCNRKGETIEVINRNIQKGMEGKLKGKKFVTYKNKKYAVHRIEGFLEIYPWGFK